MCMESESWGDIHKDAEHVNLPPVQFLDISDRYSVAEDLEIVVEFGKKFVATIDDWVGLFPLGWRTLKQYVTYQWIQQQALNGKQIINIEKTKLPTDLHQYYQFMYVNGNTTVISISAPFYFTEEEFYMDAESGQELAKELRRREIQERENMYAATTVTESKMTIDMIPEESYTSIMADSNCLYDDDTSVFCEVANSETEFRHLMKSSGGDNPEFIDSLETMALVPWTSKDDLVVPKSPNEESEPSDKSKSGRKSRREMSDAGRSNAIPLDEKGTAHLSNVMVCENENRTSSAPKVAISKQSVASSRTSSESLDQGSSAKSSKHDDPKDAHLDQVVSRFFNFLGSVIAKSESDKTLRRDKSSPCTRCGQLELDIESIKSRAYHAEYREGALVRELSTLRKQVKQQEIRTSELLDHLHLRCDDSNNVEILKGQLTQVLNELQQAAHTIHRLTQEKTNLETKVGNLMWEKAGLCAKLQVLQQGEARNSRKTSELSAGLIEAQEEIHHFNRRFTESQQFVEALLSTLSNLGFTNVKDLLGSNINLENVSGPALCLEPPIDESSPNFWSKKCKYEQPDKWFKAIMTSQEIIQQLQARINDMEEFCRGQETVPNRFDEMQKCLNDERKKSKLLENQMSQMVMTFSHDSTTFERNYLIQERIESDPSNPGYELQGARPKFVARAQLCEPVDELESEAQASIPRFCAFNQAVPSADNYPQSCPYCGETFPAYLLPNDKQEHIRMHMYSELQRNVTNNMTNQTEF